MDRPNSLVYTRNSNFFNQTKMKQNKKLFTSKYTAALVIIIGLLFIYEIISYSVQVFILPKYFVINVPEKSWFWNYSLIGAVKEGDAFRPYDLYSYQNYKRACAEGLKPIPFSYGKGGQGGCSGPMTPYYICAKCGDGVCGPDENPCSCPVDCNNNN